MLFDLRQRFARAVVGEEADLIQPHARQHEGSITARTLDRTLLQARRLDDPLKEQFDRLLAIVVEVILPRPPRCCQLLRCQDPPARLRVKVREVTTAEGLVTEQHIRHLQSPHAQGCYGDVGFVLVVRTPGSKDRDGFRQDQPLQDQALALHPAAVAALGPLGLGVDVA